MKNQSKKKVKERRKVGIAKSYISRAAAVRKLQIPLSDFRRLCILKGIYPVEPKNKSKLTGANTTRKTYFFTKDIQYLLNEPLLFKFLEFKTFMKRLTKAKGRHDVEKFQQVNDNKPIYKLDSIVKERYPRFVDALRDCDDALSMCFLFGMFPKGRGRPDDLIDYSRQLTVEFMEYIIKSKSLRKVFISIKGYYYQAEIMGQTVTWMVPHQFVIDRVSNVDINVMKTFTEFYVTLLGFINYRLNKSIGTSPINNAEKEDQQPDEFKDDEDDKTNGDSLTFHQLMALENLFKGLKFYLNREVPRESLIFIIRSFGGEVSWDKNVFPGATFDESDTSITHHIIDRDSISEKRLDRIYIQPQWVYDSVNMRMLLPTADYLIGATLPPHLSPFVNEKKGDYVPPDKLKLLKLRQQFESENQVDPETEDDEEKEANVAKKKRKPERDSNKSTKKSKMVVKKGKLNIEAKEEVKKKEDAEHRRMSVMMIAKKKKRLFDKINKTQKEKNKKTQKLRAKRKIVDAVKGV